MTQDIPKTWGEMTPEEKGALLLAHHEGKEIDFYQSGNWVTIGFGFNWFQEYAYRVKPEPKRETVRLLGYGTFANVLREDCLTEVDRRTAKYAITFDTIDGKPDCASIRMEALK